MFLNSSCTFNMLMLIFVQSKFFFFFPFSYTDLCKTIQSHCSQPESRCPFLDLDFACLGRSGIQIQCRPYQPKGRQQKMTVIFTFTRVSGEVPVLLSCLLINTCRGAIANPWKWHLCISGDSSFIVYLISYFILWNLDSYC